MSYATLQSLRDRFGEAELVRLTDRATPPTGAVAVDVVEQALRDASAEIDGYLAGRYRLPLETVPAQLEGFCCDIARFRLFGDAATERHPARLRYEAAVRYFERVAEGKIALGPDDFDEPAPPQTGGITVRRGRRCFDADSLAGFTGR